jgi:hypothetical protein
VDKQALYMRDVEFKACVSECILSSRQIRSSVHSEGLGLEQGGI